MSFGEKNIEKIIYEEESNLLESNLKFNKREELIDIYIFILYKFDKNKFNKTLNDGEIYQNSATRLYKSQKLDISVLEQIIHYIIISYSEKELTKIFQDFYHTKDALVFINDNFDIISKSLKNRNLKNIQFELQLNVKDIKSFYEMHRQIIEKQKKYDLIIIDFKRIINNLIENHECYENIKIYIDLKKYYFEQNTASQQLFIDIFDDDKKKKLEDIIHNKLISLIKLKRLTNSEVLDFMQKDKYYTDNDYANTKKRDIEIFKNFWNLSEENIREFIKLKPWIIFKNKIKEFYQIFITKIEKLDDIDIIFRLFPFVSNPENKEFLNQNYFFELILNKLKSTDDYSYIGTYRDKTILFKNLNLIYSNLCSQKKQRINFYQIIENSNFFEKETIIDLYIYINDKNKNLKEEEFSKYFEKYMNYIDAKDAIKLIKKISPFKNTLYNLFQNEEFQKYVITEKDFYNIENPDNIILYEKIMEDNNIIKGLLNTKYIKDSKNVLDDIKNKIKNSDNIQIEYSKINQLLEKKDSLTGEDRLKERLSLIYPKETKKEELDKIYSNLVKNIDICKKKLDKLNKTIKYLEIIDEKSNKKEQYIKTYKELSNGTIQMIKDDKIFTERFNQFYNDQVCKWLNYQNSAIFMKIFDEIKKMKIKDEFSAAFEVTKELFLKIADINGIENILFFENIIICQNIFNITNIFINILKLIKKYDDEKIKNEILFIYDFINKEGKLNEEEYNKISELKTNDKLISKIYELKSFSILEEMKISLNSIINFFNNLDFPKGKIIDKAKFLLDKIKNEKVTFPNINNVIDFLKELEIDIFQTDKNIIYDFLIEMSDKHKEIEFCKQKKFKEKENEPELLKELIHENEIEYLDPQDIDIFFKCINFIVAISDNKAKDELEFFECIKEKIKKDKFLLESFKIFFEKYGDLIRFFDGLDKKVSKESKITSILKYSTFSFLKEENKIQFNGMDKDKNSLDLDQLLELVEKFRFVDNRKKHEKNQKEIENYKNIVNKFKILKGQLKNLANLGSTKTIEINLEIRNGKITNKENDDTLDMIIENFQKEINKRKSDIIESYKDNTFLRFISMDFFMLVFSIVEKYRKNQINEIDKGEYNQLKFLLRAISNGKIENAKLESLDLELSEKQNLYSIINIFIREFFSINKLNVDDLLPVFKQNLIKNNDYKNGIYKATYKNKSINILNLYKKLTKNFPLTNTVLICNESTILETIEAFLYLSCYCQNNVLFCLVGLEKLDIKKRIATLNLIKNFQKNEDKMYSTLVILHLNDGNIAADLKKLIPFKIVKYEEIEDIKNKKDNDNDIEIFKSAQVGYGKSFMIQNRILEEKKEKKYFPLGGDITREKVIKRFFDLDLDSDNIQNYVIHIDLYDTKYKELLMDILFEILILKKFEFKGKIIYLGDIKFYIEIPNDFYDYLNAYPLLKLFKINYIEQLPKIQLKQDIEKIKDCKFRTVANFLKNIENGSLKMKNIDLNLPNTLSDSDCRRLFNKFLKFSDEKYNYHQIISCIDYLYHKFKAFNEFVILEDDEKNERKNGLYQTRETIINFIIDSKKILITPYDKFIKSQTTSENEKDPNKQAIESLEQLKDKIDASEKNRTTLIQFSADKSSFGIIPKDKEDEAKAKEILDYFCTVNSFYKGKLFNKDENIFDYNNKDHYELLKQLGLMSGSKEMLEMNENEELNIKLKEKIKGKLDPKIYHEHTNDYETDKINIDKDRKLYKAKLAKLQGNYTYIFDNFLKTVLIYNRIQASIPVILMGETGCGKTSLLYMLEKLMYNGSTKMKIMKCHAGTNDDDIIAFINNIENNIDSEDEEELDRKMKKFDDEKLETKGYKRNNYYLEQLQNIKEQKVWVFFDELNTSNSVGLITEIICKRTMLGKPLSERLLFLGAVNPYRTMTDKMKQSGLRYPTDKKKELVYTVNPIPQTLMCFIMNFGSLNSDEEKKYIEAMLKNGLQTHNDDSEDFNTFIKFATECISECHIFIREINDISAVSLREINRLNIFFDFFNDYLSNKSIYKANYKNKYDLLKSCLNLSIYSCYYLGIGQNKERENFSNKLSKVFGYNFLEIPDKEVSYITEQFILDKKKGIILNKSLKENLFSSFICIVNKIPLIIVGKPGESKSLSIQIIMKSMKGIYSKNKFFQQYPSIIKFNYQGSITSNSKDIIKIFNIARNYAHTHKVLVFLFFDELGLAERSPNNPLKAIHSELEYEENDDKIAFIGISNWKIDASKMNRCNILSKELHSDENELIFTSKLFYKESGLSLHSDFIEILAETYYNFIKDDNSNFYGIRDFYYLIRFAIKELKNIISKQKEEKINPDILAEIGFKSLSRNFGGKEMELDNIKNIFEKLFYCNKNVINIFNNNYSLIDWISDNLCDYNSRYLMLIIEDMISINALKNLIRKQNKKFYILEGSISDDINENKENEIKEIEYLLNQIKCYMSEDCILILKDLEKIYPSLYELFNLNYMRFGNKYYTKIAFSNSKISSEVNPKFKVILLTSKEQIDNNKMDTPLINRFEKQRVKFLDLIPDRPKFENKKMKFDKTIKKVMNNFEKIKTFNGKENIKHKFRYNISGLIIFKENKLNGLLME